MLIIFKYLQRVSLFGQNMTRRVLFCSPRYFFHSNKILKINKLQLEKKWEIISLGQDLYSIYLLKPKQYDKNYLNIIWGRFPMQPQERPRQALTIWRLSNLDFRLEYGATDWKQWPEFDDIFCICTPEGNGLLRLRPVLTLQNPADLHSDLDLSRILECLWIISWLDASS